MPIGLNLPGCTTAVPRNTAANAGSRYVVEMFGSYPPRLAVTITPASPQIAPEAT
jgi:hypothetical protein